MTDDPITSPDAQQAPVSPAGTRPAPITDEQLREMMRNEEPSFFERNSGRVVTLALIAVNVACFVAEMLISGTGQDISILTLVQMGAMYAPMVQGPADLYRFVAPMFLHMDLMHLLFNMVALYSVGELLERVLGRGNFLLLYFVAGITGNVVSYSRFIKSPTQTLLLHYCDGILRLVYNLSEALNLFNVRLGGHSSRRVGSCHAPCFRTESRTFSCALCVLRGFLAASSGCTHCCRTIRWQP